MKIAIVGGTGFIGGHLARSLIASGHQLVLIARGVTPGNEDLLRNPAVTFQRLDMGQASGLISALAGCELVAHCAGINRERKRQTYERVHVEGTRHVVRAAQQAGVKKLVLLSYLRARPESGILYHESKWQAEEIVRSCGLRYTVIRAGMNYGKGDHFLHHLSRALRTFPVIALLGLWDEQIRPIAVDDLIHVFRAALLEDRLAGQTVAVVGPEELPLSEAIQRVAAVVGKQPRFWRMPVFVHRLLARFFEWFMHVPLISRAQVQILAEGLAEPSPGCLPLPPDLEPRRVFSTERIRQGLPGAKPFGLGYCLVCIAKGAGRTGRCPMREAEAKAAQEPLMQIGIRDR